MAVARSIALRAVALAALIAVVSADDALFGLLRSYPANCGSVVQIKAGDTCQSIADYAGISVSKLQDLNPLMLCLLVPLMVGQPICTGNTLAFCNNLYTASAGETCAALKVNVLGILGLQLGASCDRPLPADTQVCVTTQANKCAQDTICGQAISQPLQKMLGGLSDYCDILRECKAEVGSISVEDKPALTLKLSSITPAVDGVLSNDGHPELSAWAKNVDSGKPSFLQYTLIPGYYPDGSDAIAFLGTTALPGSRRLLGGQPVYNSGPTGGVTRAYWQYY